MKPNTDVVHVEVLDGYRLRLRFADGRVGVALRRGGGAAFRSWVILDSAIHRRCC
jgi:hypothetical protein